MKYPIPINHKTIFAFADTHGNHRKVTIPNDVDIIVFAGDACVAGDETQLADFFEWYVSLPVPYKLFVPGNHDLPFDLSPNMAAHMIPTGITYVENGAVMLDSIRFYVLPARPFLHEFTAPAHILAEIDVLVTHNAPMGVLDGGKGCPLLRTLVNESQPPIHIFGHEHAFGGKFLKTCKTIFYNVSMQNDRDYTQ
jgi:predicted phosphodiesterase